MGNEREGSLSSGVLAVGAGSGERDDQCGLEACKQALPMATIDIDSIVMTCLWLLLRWGICPSGDGSAGLAGMPSKQSGAFSLTSGSGQHAARSPSPTRPLRLR